MDPCHHQDPGKSPLLDLPVSEALAGRRLCPKNPSGPIYYQCYHLYNQKDPLFSPVVFQAYK
jgi:hypothetical protein